MSALLLLTPCPGSLGCGSFVLSPPPPALLAKSKGTAFSKSFLFRLYEKRRVLCECLRAVQCNVFDALMCLLVWVQCLFCNGFSLRMLGLSELIKPTLTEGEVKERVCRFVFSYCIHVFCNLLECHTVHAGTLWDSFMMQTEQQSLWISFHKNKPLHPLSQETRLSTNCWCLHELSSSDSIYN